MVKNKFKEYFYWVLIIILAIISYYIIKDFIVAIVSSFVLSFIVLPLHNLLSKKTNNKVSALISLIIVLIIVLLLGSFIATTLISQFSSLTTGNFVQNSIDSISKLISESEFIPSIPSLESLIKDAASSLVNSLYNAITYVPHFLLTIVLTFFISYYLLIDWDNIKNKIIEIIPLKNKKELVNRISQTSKNIIHGALLTALVSFIAAIAGFYLAGVSFWAFFAFLVGIFTFIPVIGPVLIWLPLLLVELIQGNFIGVIILLITGITLSTLIDDLIRMWIIGKEARLNPVIVLIGILGGIPIFGIAGFIIGPLILSIFIEIIRTNMENS